MTWFGVAENLASVVHHHHLIRILKAVVQQYVSSNIKQDKQFMKLLRWAIFLKVTYKNTLGNILRTLVYFVFTI